MFVLLPLEQRLNTVQFCLQFISISFGGMKIVSVFVFACCVPHLHIVGNVLVMNDECVVTSDLFLLYIK